MTFQQIMRIFIAFVKDQVLPSLKEYLESLSYQESSSMLGSIIPTLTAMLPVFALVGLTLAMPTDTNSPSWGTEIRPKPKADPGSALKAAVTALMHHLDAIGSTLEPVDQWARAMFNTSGTVCTAKEDNPSWEGWTEAQHKQLLYLVKRFSDLGEDAARLIDQALREIEEQDKGRPSGSALLVGCDEWADRFAETHQTVFNFFSRDPPMSLGPAERRRWQRQRKRYTDSVVGLMESGQAFKDAVARLHADDGKGHPPKEQGIAKRETSAKERRGRG